MGEKCVHCGEDCGKNPVIWDGKPFCCHGCSTVYQILNEKKLDKYYEIQPMSGIKIDREEVGDKYAYLDNPEIAESLLSFSDGGFSKVTLFIPTIHCASCIWLLENLHTLDAGIIRSSVNFPKKLVNITFRPEEISLRKIVEMLVSIHYVPEINLKQTEKGKNSKSERDLLIKIGIAGFSLMNVMLYNFPEYLPGGDKLTPLFTKFFGWMSMLLAIPVVFYSASDYYLSAYKALKHKIVNIDLPITLGIFTLFFQSVYDVLSGQGIGYMDSLTGLVFFLLLGKWYQNKTYQALSFERDYKSYFPVAVTLLDENNKRTTVPLANLKKGDVMLIRNQELIPADAELLSETAQIDYAFVTGEALPVEKKKGDMVFAGGRQVGHTIRLKVLKSVEQSYLTQLWNQDAAHQSSPSQLDTVVNKVSEYFTAVILLVAASAGVFWLFHNPSLALFAFTSVLIIACPCALALTVPFTFGGTMRAFGRKGFYIKNTGVIENLHHINAVVFDKTGTITLSHSMKATFVGEPLTEEQEHMVKAITSHSTHPLSQSIFYSLEGEELPEVEDFQEIPAMGISGTIHGKKINIGSKVFVMGTRSGTDVATHVYVFIDGHVPGYFQIENRYRPGLKEVIGSLKKQADIYLLSGDNDAEKTNIQEIFGQDSGLYFNQSPTDKRDFIKKLKKEGKTILMVGDGLNDAGALLESDVGLTIADDIYNFSPACDGIIEA
ncbi:MAG TPA: HAD family hydrolase, partial [Bacteroidetes bacterium]|nr:HAD family hydrolase [Bacteroidota bacterium]